MGARANNRHLAFQDIEQLGKLIDAGPANPVTDAGNARVIALSGMDPVSIARRQSHRPELVHGEKAVAAPDAALHEQRWSSVLDPDGQGYDQQKRRQHDQCHDREREIKSPLERTGAQTQWADRYPQEAATGNDPRSLCAKLCDRIVDHLAVDVGAFQNGGPGKTARWVARHSDAVDTAQQQTYPVECDRIVQSRSNGMGCCID